MSDEPTRFVRTAGVRDGEDESVTDDSPSVSSEASLEEVELASSDEEEYDAGQEDREYEDCEEYEDEDADDGAEDEEEEGMFRESALERLSSPDQLDRCLRVTSPKGWVALIAVWALLATIVTWSIVGSVPTKEGGQGILVAGGGLRQVVASGAGRLDAILVAVDDRVEPGQIVALIDQQDLADQHNEANSQLAQLREQSQILDALDEQEEQLQRQLAEVETKRIQQVIAFSSERLDRLRARRALTQQLIVDGAVSEMELERIDEEMETTQVAAEQARIELEHLVAKNRHASFHRERERMNRRLQIDELERRMAMIEARLERESQVASPIAGRVVEVRAAVHTTVAVGSPILLVERQDERGEGAVAHSELEAILYVSAATGKRIRRGMDVEVSPGTVKREEHGSMRGAVSFVADVPTSKSAMMAVLSDSDLVEQFTRDIGLPLEVRVELLRDPRTPSGYAWTSAMGPPTRVSAGTLCTGSVTIERQRPINLVIPMLKRGSGS